MLGGAAGVAVFSVGMALLLTGFVEDRLLARDARLSADFVQSIVDTQQVAGHFTRPVAAGDAAFAEFLAHIAAMPDVLRTNVYDRQQRVLWSSTPSLIGQQFGANEELDDALRGEVVAAFDSEDDKAEHVFLGSRREFVETYVPVRDAAATVVGVIELYRRPVALTDTLAQGRRRIWTAALLGGAALMLSLLWFVRRIERTLREQQRQLVDHESLAMVGELSAAVAHSIRNPLGSIRSAAELRRELGDAAPLDHELVIRHVDRIEHLVRTLLSTVNQSGQRPARCAVRPVLEAARARLAPDLAQQGKRLLCRWPDQLGEAPLDELLLTQSLASVLANAAEATQAGDEIRLLASLQPGQLDIVVEDTGAGLGGRPPEQLLQPFVTTKPRGLGLGLPLAKRAMERAGGSLAVESMPGGGTRVTLRLPSTAPEGDRP